MSSPNRPTKGRRLSHRDRQIIEHVVRYRLTTIQVLCRAVLPNVSRGAVAKITGRLCDADYLQKYTLLHPTKYFVLGKAGAKLFGLDDQRAAPLGPQSLPIEYVLLIYAALGRQPRVRLTPVEVLAKWPWLKPELAAAPHCWDEKHAILELVRVDLGGPADHVARKCAVDLNKRRQHREFSPLVAQGRFRLVVITATSEKAAALRQALDRHDWPPRLLIHLSVVPQLLSLSARRNHA